MILPVFLARKALAWGAFALVTGCGFPHYDFGSGGQADASSGADAGPTTEVRGCTTSADCVGDPGGRFCDTERASCVDCMAGGPPCAPGLYCDSLQKCVIGCSVDADCGPSLRADGARAADIDAGSAEPLTCNESTRRCVGCTADGDCPIGTLCGTTSPTCIPGCNLLRGCPDGFACCDRQCIAESQQCQVSCSPGFADCNHNLADGCEIQLNSNDDCAACGRTCIYPFRASTCQSGVCQQGPCNTGRKDCNQWPDDGCETDLASDASHCGECGNACVNPHGSSVCSAGKCVPTCAQGWDSCGDDTSGGCTVDLSTDPLNCGACGHACKGGNCTGGSCVDCPDAQPTKNDPCTTTAECGPYSGSDSSACYCFCVNNLVDCRIGDRTGAGC